jgi:hypothetical protein
MIDGGQFRAGRAQSGKNLRQQISGHGLETHF